MPTQEKGKFTVINTPYLTGLDSTQLIDLLNHKTQLLVSARNSGIQEPVYLKNLQEEVERIQSEIWVRNL